LDNDVKDPGSRLRWRIQLEGYDYEIIYKPGAQNCNAGAISRRNVIARKEGNPGKMDEKSKAEILKEYHDPLFEGTGE
jgi:hypothetical protein